METEPAVVAGLSEQRWIPVGFPAPLPRNPATREPSERPLMPRHGNSNSSHYASSRSTRTHTHAQTQTQAKERTAIGGTAIGYRGTAQCVERKSRSK